jgi:hypothetical protein
MLVSSNGNDTRASDWFSSTNKEESQLTMRSFHPKILFPLLWQQHNITYPQGGASFLPQVLAAAALYGSVAAFSTREVLEDSWLNHAPNFLCLLIKTRTKSGRFLVLSTNAPYPVTNPESGSSPSTYGNRWSYQHECFPFTFHDSDYWDIDKEEDTQ